MLISFGVLTFCSLGGFTIWKLTHNKNKDNEQEKSERPNTQDSQDSKSEQNKIRDLKSNKDEQENRQSQVKKVNNKINQDNNKILNIEANNYNNDIERCNMNWLNSAILKAKNGEKLFTDEQSMRNVILALFNKVKNSGSVISGHDLFKSLYEICNNRQKISSLEINKSYDENKNYINVQGNLDMYYQFCWRSKKCAVVAVYVWSKSEHMYVAEAEHELFGDDIAEPTWDVQNF